MLIEMHLQCSPYIPGIPQGRDAAWAHATRNDDITLTSWHDQWIDQTKANFEKYNFSESSAMLLHGKEANKPIILAGSGEALQHNWMQLRGDGNLPGRCDIRIVSALHNFAFFEDRDIMTSEDYYITLDAGDITIREVYEGGKHPEEWYWERTKNRVLLAYHASPPELIEKWKGPIYWFTTPGASPEILEKLFQYIDITKIPGFNVGGNVMGGALYFARAILGCSIPIFIGMNLAFGYNKQFHGWKSPYDDKYSGLIPCTDIYGNRVFTWPSYWGFKNWFDFMATGGKGGNAQLWINATEGGIMGAYPEGNIQQIIQLDLRTALQMFNVYKKMPELLSRGAKGEIHLLF